MVLFKSSAKNPQEYPSRGLQRKSLILARISSSTCQEDQNSVQCLSFFQTLSHWLGLLLQPSRPEPEVLRVERKETKVNSSLFTHCCANWCTGREEVHCSTSRLGKGSSAVMKNNNTMPVVLSFVPCLLFAYVYQDAGGGIKAWISCDGWISSPALQSGQLFWHSKFILAHRNVDLHHADAAGSRGPNLLV